MKALTARLLFERDVHYLVRDGKVCIIDEYTGRVMADRFWNDGLHQMIEAKEGCAPSGQRASVARITYQRFFTRYHHLCGMSGTLARGHAANCGPSMASASPASRPTIRSRRHVEQTLIVADRRGEMAHHRRPCDDTVGGRPAGADRHAVRRRVGTGEQPAARSRRRAQSAQRGAGRGRGGDRRAGRRCRLRHHRHQHGRPRHRHPAGPRRLRSRRPGGDPERPARRGAGSTVNSPDAARVKATRGRSSRCCRWRMR